MDIHVKQVEMCTIDATGCYDRFELHDILDCIYCMAMIIMQYMNVPYRMNLQGLDRHCLAG